MRFVQEYKGFNRAGDYEVKCEFCGLGCISTQDLDYSKCPHCNEKTLTIDSKIKSQIKAISQARKLSRKI